MGNPSQFRRAVVVIVAVFHLAGAASAVDFHFNSFINGSNELQLIRDAHVGRPVIRLTRDNTQSSSVGRAFFPVPIRMRRQTAGRVTIASFSTSFVFSITHEMKNFAPGFGMAFVISNSTDPPGALPGQYFGLFTNSTVPTAAPLLAVEFDTGRNHELGDPNDNHAGVDLNSVRSAVTTSSRYGWPSLFTYETLYMWSGYNFRAWIDFDGASLRINVTIAMAGDKRPKLPLLSYADPSIADYISNDMYVGFSASKVISPGVTWVERQRLLAWSFTDEGRPARELNTSDMPYFWSENLDSSSSSSTSPNSGAIAGIVVGAVAAVGLAAAAAFWVWRRQCRKADDDDEAMHWELEYWPHRFSYDELFAATKGFAKERLLGFGGFGKVYKGILPNCSVKESAAIAVKYISHDSKQGLREFMAEISSMGRLRHKNLVPMRGWCRQGNELMLVYDYMPNGSLNRRIFDQYPQDPLGWEARLRILADVAQGLDYLHHGWDKVVIHRDIKSSNILLDGEMRGRLGDFGLAKLCEHGQAPSSTRLIGTLGYMAPELARRKAPTVASDVYSFGVVVLELASGRRPIEYGEEVATVLVDVVRELFEAGRVVEAADWRIQPAAYPLEEMEKVLELGLRCCHPDPDGRPTMKEVVSVLLGEDGGPNAGIFPGLDRRVVDESSQ